MLIWNNSPTQAIVALRKESVDRNIPAGRYALLVNIVALRKESVDRNMRFLYSLFMPWCRSPQGERG